MTGMTTDMAGENGDRNGDSLRSHKITRRRMFQEDWTTSSTDSEESPESSDESSDDPTLEDRRSPRRRGSSTSIGAASSASIDILASIDPEEPSFEAVPHSPQQVVKPPVLKPGVGLGGAGRALAAAYQASENIPYKRAEIPEPTLTFHDKNFCKALVSMLEKRKNYLYKIHTVHREEAWDPKELEKRGQAEDYIEASPMSMEPFKVEPKAKSELEFKLENGVFIPVNEEHSIAIPVPARVFYADLHDLSR